MAPYFQRMKLVSSSWLCPRTILDQTTTVTLGAPRVNDWAIHLAKCIVLTIGHILLCLKIHGSESGGQEPTKGMSTIKMHTTSIQ